MGKDVMTVERVRVSVKNGKMYKVVLHNDNTTEMTFVVGVLVKVFHKAIDDAFAIMMAVHLTGKMAVDTYPKKLAEARRNAALRMAKDAGYNDFTVTVEEA